MADKDSIQIGTEAERATYATLPALQRAELAQEMANEVIDHYDHARTLVAAIVTELRTMGTEEKTALHLAEVAEAWLNDRDHINQEGRMFACLHAMVGAHHQLPEVSHA
jgi:CHASE3 domain sensor protein